MRHQDRQGLSRPVLAGAIVALALVIGLPVLAPALADDNIATLRGGAINVEKDPPRLANEENLDKRRVRNYPEQPPTIPHKVSDYQIDLNVNACLGCHSREAVEQSQAPMVSVTHFMDREGQVRAFVSARRYFCLQCHVPQTGVQPLVGNSFIDVDKLIKGGKGG